MSPNSCISLVLYPSVYRLCLQNEGKKQIVPVYVIKIKWQQKLLWLIPNNIT